MATLKIKYLCAVDITSKDSKELTQEIGDIPNESVSGIKNRISQMNTALQQVSFNTVLNNETQVNKYATAIKCAFATTNGNQTSPTAWYVQKITSAELIAQETQNIYNYAQVGA